MAHCAVFVRTAVSTMLYQKSLRVSAAGRAKTSIGQVVNIMSNDTSQLQSFLQFASLMVVAPLQMAMALVLIYRQVGHATWVGIAYMISLMPINVVIFSIASKQRREVLKYSDSRVKTMNEILAGIRAIKFYAWEQPFRLQVSSLRGKELEALTKLAYTSAIGFSLILLSVPLIQPILVFLTYVSIQSDPLSAAVAFTTIALFNIMRIPFAVLPMGFQQYIQSKIAVGRIERYLDFPELPDYVESSPPFAERGSPSIEEGGLVIQNGSFSWFDLEGKLTRPIQDAKSKKRHTSLRPSAVALPDTDLAVSGHSVSSCTSVETEGNLTGPAIALQDLNCSIEPGSLVAVVGEVGSGKTSFLSAILGEMEPVQGSKMHIPRPADCPAGYISYCSQTPWVVNDTLRGNILFGRELDEERYNAVLEACALLDDLAILPACDSTEIGERGINLSGGQKARVSLARALYSRDTRLVLMDDPLSAVDSHVGEHIFAKAIRGPLAEGTTRILVTHHVHLLSRCDWIIVLDHGRIRHQGTYKDLVASGVDFAGAVDVSRAKTADEVDVTVQEEVKHVEKAKGLSDEKTADLMKKSGEKLVKDEEREKGSIAGSIYIHYGKVGGLQIVAMAFIVQGFGKASEVASGFWLSRWAKDTLEALMEGAPFSTTTTYRYLGIYALFGLLGVLGLTGRSLLMAVHRMRSSKKLHKDLLESILRAPVSFFDVTPTGRILNRFAADMDRIDLQLMQTVSQAISAFFNTLGALGAMVAATKGAFAIPLVPVAFIYYLIQRWFRKTYTELQRINSIANSPIFADFSQTLSGTSTIRAYAEETRFFDHCKYSFDSMNPSYILVQLTSNWLGLRLGVLGGLMGAFVGAIAVGTSSSGFVPAGWLGLALSYSIDVTNFLKLGVQTIATLEAQMNSVERVLYYTNSIESEAPEIIPDKDPSPGTWPMSGEIELQHASMRYRDGPLVLKDISLRVKGGEKVGVIGRTGSGKSSMMVLLFRISEIEKDGGKVVIDGVDTAEIGTATLRLNLSIIPQEPVIFSNTVRYNIDPFGNSNEEELWEVLKKTQMAEVVAALPGGLNAQVAEGGENFSQGQRQLLCIARSLLRNPKILVMDEATASIDNTTDNAIQAMIRENFKDATVLTIAHRLNTIMDSDRVLVLEQGRIAEYDTPEMLLKKKDGLFRSMVDKSRATNSRKIVKE